LILIIIFAKINKNNMIPSGTRFIGFSDSVNLTERRSASVNAETAVYTVDELRGYKVYTALLTQSGGDSLIEITSGLLTVGVSYNITSSSTGDDFRNVGGPLITTDDEFLETYFVATGTTPTNWTNETVLGYNTGAPVVTVLENTIGNIWFIYSADGEYYINSNDLFTQDKVFTIVTNNIDWYDTGVVPTITLEPQPARSIFIRTGGLDEHYNDVLGNAPIEIRVYN
jgi:hypothetical protein